MAKAYKYMICSIKNIISLWLILTTLFSPWLAQANNEARVYLQNVPLQDEKLLVVNVMLADVVDLYGAEIQLRYDPAQLQVRDDNARLEGVQIAPGPLLAFDDRFVAVNRVDTAAGLINFVFTLLRPTPPISDGGALAAIVFEISGDGPYSVEVSRAQLASVNSEALPVTTENLYLNGALEPIAAPQPIISPWPAWRWWGSAALLSLLMVLVFLVLIRTRRAVTTAPAGAHPGPRRMPGASRSSTRSSALLAKQGNHALNQGDIQRAYELFSQAIALDPTNTAAWLGKGLVAQQETEKRICFQRVLALDPDNQVATKGLQQLER